MKKFYFLATMLVACLYSFAQDLVPGIVTDNQTGKSIAFATVTFTGNRILADESGVFSVPRSAGSITVSHVGYQSQTVEIGSNTQLRVRLSAGTATLDVVEITATSTRNKRLLYQPMSITKLSEFELQRATGLFLDDAINTNVPGVSMNRRTVSAGQQFNIRGYGNGVRGTNGISSNFDGQGYKVYLNGIPITDAEGITLMDDIDFGSIGNVEVVKGPSGTLYGLAIAGVVNLRSLRAEPGKTSIGQQALVGRYGLQRFTTTFSTATDKTSILANYGYQESEGYMAHTASMKRFLNVIGDFTVNEKQSLSAYLGYSNSYDQRGGELTIAQYDNNDYSGNPAYIKNNAHSEVISFRGGVSHTYRFNTLVSNTTTLFGTGLASNVSSAGGWTDKNPVNYGLRSTFDTRFAMGGGSTLSGITGVETQSQYAQTLGYVMGTNTADPAGYNVITSTRSNQYTKTGTTSLFTEWTLALPQDLSLTAGVGYSNMLITLNDRMATVGRPSAFSRNYKSLVSPHAAINKVFSKAFSLYASYSVGYKAPVSSYFFIPFTGEVNQNLEPEMGVQFEVGSKGSMVKDKLAYELAVFQARFKDKMSAVAVPNAAGTATAYSYIVNSGEQNNKGIEASLRYTAYSALNGALRFVRPFVNATYSDFRYKDFKFQTNALLAPINYDGKQVPGVPRKVVNGGLDLGFAGGLYLSAWYNYRDAMRLTSDGSVSGQPYHVSSYNLLNGKIGIRSSLSSHFSLDASFACTNITGQKYYYMVFINQLPDAYLPAPKDAFYFGNLNLRYSF